MLSIDHDELTCDVISEADGGEGHEWEVEAVQVSPAVLDVPEDHSREDDEDDEPCQKFNMILT